MSVIGEDGQEIRVQIVRKDPSDMQTEPQLEVCRSSMSIPYTSLFVVCTLIHLAETRSI